MRFPILSHTFLADWDNCSFKAFRKYIAKDLPREPASQAMSWGISVHSAFEARIKHNTPLPETMPYEAIAAPLVAAGAKAELALGIKVDGGPCDFWDKDAFLRGKLDTSILSGEAAAIMDIKTGKLREDKAELATHAVLLKAHEPKLTKITGFYVWLQEKRVGKPHDVSDTEKKLAEIRSVANVIKNSMAVGFFPKRQNGLCGWCPVKDCEFNRS